MGPEQRIDPSQMSEKDRQMMGMDTSGASREGEESHVQSQEIAHEMAQAEIGPREKLEVAKELGLGDAALKELGLEVDQEAQKRREEYEKAMNTADHYLARLLMSPNGKLDVEIGPHGPDTFPTQEIRDLYNALSYRIKTPDEKYDRMISKTLNLGGEERHISWSSLYEPKKSESVLLSLRLK